MRSGEFKANFGQVGKRHVSISSTGTNKQGLRDALLRPKLLLLGDVHTLAKKTPKMDGSDLHSSLDQLVITQAFQLSGMYIVVQRWQRIAAALTLTLLLCHDSHGHCVTSSSPKLFLSAVKPPQFANSCWCKPAQVYSKCCCFHKLFKANLPKGTFRTHTCCNKHTVLIQSFWGFQTYDSTVCICSLFTARGPERLRVIKRLINSSLNLPIHFFFC